MSKKSAEEIRKGEVYQAIESLYRLFPAVNRCIDVKTMETVAIEKKIKQREAELQNDAKLVSLKESLAKVKKETAATVRESRAKIAALHRQLNLRGVTESLIKEVEKVAASKPVVILDRYECE